MDGVLSWLAAVSNLSGITVLQSSRLRTGERLLLTGRSAAKQTGNKSFAVRDAESPGYFFVVTGEVSAHLYITLVSHLCVHCSAAEKKLLREALRWN